VRHAACVHLREMSAGVQHVWYGSFGSNLCSERFRCYLRGGKVEGMSVEQPGARDPTVPFAVPPTKSCPTTSIVVPHRIFFAKVSPWWSNGGVAFLDVSTEEKDESFHSTLRCWRITLDQFNDVFAQENGLHPREEAAEKVRFSSEEVIELARTKSGSHRIRDGAWYGYVRALGFAEADELEPILTFTLPPHELEAIRAGAVDDVNPPSPGYHDVIARGLCELGLERETADEYLRARYTLV